MIKAVMHPHHVAMNGVHPEELPAEAANGSVFDRLMEPVSAAEMLDMLHLPVFVLLAGLVLWHVLLVGRTEREARQHRIWTMNLLKLQLLFLLGATAAATAETVGWHDWEEVRGYLTDTTPGFSRSVLLVLSAAGLLLLQRWKAFDLLWLIAFIAAKTQIGHAAANDERLLASAMTGIHLAAAGLWAGGILLLTLMWRRFRFEAERLFPTVSGAVLAAFILLVMSGLVNSMIYLPDLSYLPETRWGLLLILKLALVVTVAALGAWIRRRFTARGGKPIGALLKLDLALLIAIAGIASLGASSEPVPANEPLHWHEMGAEVHMTAEITPKAPGANSFEVTLWLPEGADGPELVEMNLYPGKSGGEPRRIPLVPAEERELGYGFPGFDVYYYAARGDQLDDRGWWRVEVMVVGPGGKEWRYERLIRVY